MELSKIQIRNFRSIEDLTIYLSPRCRVLVGINESGKSNILRALSMLSNEQNPTDEDRRDPLPDEAPITEAYVRFIFKLDKTEQQQIFEKAKEVILTKDIKKPLMVSNIVKMSLKEFCGTKSEGLFRVNILDKNKSASYWSFNENKYKFLDFWKKVSDKCPAAYSIVGSDGSNKPLKSIKLVNTEDYPDIPSEYLEDVSPAHLNTIVGSEIINVINKGLPDCTFWEYNEVNLLPGRINLDNFMNNPSTCLPLKHMFELADYIDIKSAIIEEQKRPNGLRNLLKRVADRTTKHIRNVWKEYKDIKILLSENGSNIDAGIEDKFNIYNFARRSDGFKRFITFLLMISARERTKQLKNTLLLIDEPDIGLHPSGAKYLRDELIKISETNFVVYSTHSIYMIDRENTERHLIVKKESEVTSIADVNQSNIKDEEVIYNALGSSIFENLEKKNIVFEGWRDKRLFKIAIKSPSKKFKGLKESFKCVGTLHFPRFNGHTERLGYNITL